MPAVLSEDALNRYRITHPDKDLRPLIRRIHKLPLLARVRVDPNDAPSEQDALEQSKDDADRERELVRLEVLKWKAQIERVLASARNLRRQGERYRRRAEETSRQAEALEATLEEEKRQLATKLKERDHMMRCDEVHAQITARPKSREELEEQITLLKAQIETHRTSHAAYLEIVQRRVDVFAAILPIVTEAKNMKLPVELSSEADAEGADEGGMEVDGDPDAPTGESSGGSGGGGEGDRRGLSGAALPFIPAATTSLSTRNTPAPPPPAPPAGPAGGRAASHALPHRPSRKSPSGSVGPASRSGPGPMGRATSASLPQRPSGLRSSVTPGRSLLEEGEVEGEEGEVAVHDRKSRGGSRRR